MVSLRLASQRPFAGLPEQLPYAPFRERSWTEFGHNSDLGSFKHAKTKGRNRWRTRRVQLANVTTAAIATALGVSWVYASHIRAGAKRPHPRHWVKLAGLVKLGNDSELHTPPAL